MSKADEVYKRVKEIEAESPEMSRPQIFAKIQEESGMNVAAVSANFYRAQRSDPSAPKRSTGSRKAPAAAKAAPAEPATASAAPARRSPAGRKAASSRGPARKSRASSASRGGGAGTPASLRAAIESITRVAEENVALRAQVTELEGKLANARGALK